ISPHGAAILARPGRQGSISGDEWNSTAEHRGARGVLARCFATPGGRATSQRGTSDDLSDRPPELAFSDHPATSECEGEAPCCGRRAGTVHGWNHSKVG